MVLIGDAAHTAHFSVGSGTRLAMLDGIALTSALSDHDDVREALEAYEAERRPPVESLQRAAQASLQWFEDTERYVDLEPVQFGFSLLTRSLRISHTNLRERDPVYVDKVDAWVARTAAEQSGVSLRAHQEGLPARNLRSPRRCSPRFGYGNWCSPTVWACRRCASTAVTTAWWMIGTWSTSGRGRWAGPDLLSRR